MHTLLVKYDLAIYRINCDCRTLQIQQIKVYWNSSDFIRLTLDRLFHLRG